MLFEYKNIMRVSSQFIRKYYQSFKDLTSKEESRIYSYFTPLEIMYS